MMRVKKKFIFIIIILLVVSSTIAFLYSSDTFQNIFVAASYKVTVVETFESPDNWKPGDTTPKTATIKNEGTVPIKVRVKLDEVWKDSNNQDLPLQHNDENVSIINFANEDDYIYKNGYYYYDLALNPGETTSSIIESVTFNPNYSGTVTCVENDDNTHTCSSSDDGYEGGTYKLTLTIEGVQEDYYVQAWNLSGIIERQYLYNVLQHEAENGSLAHKYTGEHHDSFTEEPSKDIYHWYALNNIASGQVKGKNNVIFGNHCWQMIRTTDTGGVKMIYNGEAENNQCLDTRGKHVGYASITTQSLNSNYWYGTDYIYDSLNKVFSLSGTTEQVTWNATTGPTLIGKYTCKSATETATCSTLYLIESYNTATGAYAISLKSDSNYSQFGVLKYNQKRDSPTYVGYVYGDEYKINSIYRTSMAFQRKQQLETGSFITLNTSNWYADEISYNSSTGKYSLVNPYKINSAADFSSLLGKYTISITPATTSYISVLYIYKINGSTAYVKTLSGGQLLSDFEPITYGPSIAENNDNTYTINNPQNTNIIDLINNNSFSMLENMYICINSGSTCSNPRYVTGPDSDGYNYIPVTDNLLISKARNGLNLLDTLIVPKYKLILDSNLYSDYKYTCRSLSDVCTEDNLSLIIDYYNLYGKVVGLHYVPNYYYGSGVIWDGNNYTLQDTIGLEAYGNADNILNHHYVCETPGTNVCSKVRYIYYSNNNNVYYTSLSNGITDVSIALENMLTKNTTNSTIKNGVDAWYKHFLLDYDEYIEDTIFCNDRNIKNLSGWDASKNIANDYLQFKEYSVTGDLNCTNITDRFSVSNSNAKLTYKVGLVSSPEIKLLNDKYTIVTGESYWLFSPDFFRPDGYAYVRGISSNDNNYDISVSNDAGIRPSISLKPGIEYESGDGSMENPYIVKMD